MREINVSDISDICSSLGRARTIDCAVACSITYSRNQRTWVDMGGTSTHRTHIALRHRRHPCQPKVGPIVGFDKCARVLVFPVWS